MNSQRAFRLETLAALMLWTGVCGSAEQLTSTSLPTARTKTVSSKVLQAVTEKVPKYAPPAPTPTTESAAEDTPTSEDVLKLPKFTVRGAPPPVADASWLTPQARLELAMKKHSGLRFGNFFGSNHDVALEMQLEEREKEKRGVLSDTVQRATRDNGPDSKRIKQLLRSTVQLPSNDWLTGHPGR